MHERTTILDKRANADPDGIKIFVEALRALDPLLLETRLQQAADQLGQLDEQRPLLLAAARRIQSLGATGLNSTKPLPTP